jgi:hypothetical protein
MSVQVTLTFATLEIAITALAALRSTDAKVEVAPNAAAPASAPTPEKTKKAAASSPSAAPAPTAAPATPPAASPAPADAYKPVGDAIAKKVADGHKPAAVALLAKFGAKSGKELKPEQYDTFMAELAAIGAPADDIS